MLLHPPQQHMDLSLLKSYSGGGRAVTSAVSSLHGPPLLEGMAAALQLIVEGLRQGESCVVVLCRFEEAPLQIESDAEAYLEEAGVVPLGSRVEQGSQQAVDPIGVPSPRRLAPLDPSPVAQKAVRLEVGVSEELLTELLDLPLDGSELIPEGSRQSIAIGE